MKILKILYEANRVTKINLSSCYFFLDLLRSTTQSKTFSKANRRSTIITFAVGLSKYEHKMQIFTQKCLKIPKESIRSRKSKKGHMVQWTKEKGQKDKTFHSKRATRTH
jgi:hypothetical protein